MGTAPLTCTASFWPRIPWDIVILHSREGDRWRWKKDDNRKIEKFRTEENEQRNWRNEKGREHECLMRMWESWIDLIMLCQADESVTTVCVFSTSSQMLLCAFGIVVRHKTNIDFLRPDSLTVGRKEFQRSSDLTRSLPSSPKRLAVVPPKPQSPGEPPLWNSTTE